MGQRQPASGCVLLPLASDLKPPPPVSFPLHGVSAGLHCVGNRGIRAGTGRAAIISRPIGPGSRVCIAGRQIVVPVGIAVWSIVLIVAVRIIAICIVVICVITIRIVRVSFSVARII